MVKLRCPLLKAKQGYKSQKLINKFMALVPWNASSQVTYDEFLEPPFERPQRSCHWT